MPEAVETRLRISGLEVALREWGPRDAPPLLALHGWLDNAATFDALAPLLPDFRILAPDLTGHGLSAHRPSGAHYYIWSYVEEVLALADQVQLPRFALLGHSMGGAVGLLLAAVAPERVSRLALLDSVGPLSTAPEQAPAQLRKALERQPAGGVRHYASRQEAEAARVSRGIGGPRVASVLAARSLAEDAKGWYWRSDRRLSRANPLSLDEAQVAAFLRQASCPKLLISSPFLYREREAFYRRRLACLDALELVEMSGSHHQHLEDEAPQVAARLRGFFAAWRQELPAEEEGAAARRAD